MNTYPKYRYPEPVKIENRQWPDRILTQPPVWASVDLRDGILTIRCDSPAWTTTLTYMIPLLTDTIRRRLEGLTINEVRVTGPQQQGFSRGRMTRRPRY